MWIVLVGLRSVSVCVYRILYFGSCVLCILVMWIVYFGSCVFWFMWIVYFGSCELCILVPVNCVFWFLWIVYFGSCELCILVPVNCVFWFMWIVYFGSCELCILVHVYDVSSQGTEECMINVHYHDLKCFRWGDKPGFSACIHMQKYHLKCTVHNLSLVHTFLSHLSLV